MVHNKPNSNGKRGAWPGRKRIRVEATRRERVDPDMIALCYWLLAQRIVEDATDDGGTASDRPTHHDAEPDRPTVGADS